MTPKQATYKDLTCRKPRRDRECPSRARSALVSGLSVRLWFSAYYWATREARYFGWRKNLENVNHPTDKIAMYSTCNKPIAVHLVGRRKLNVPVGWHFAVAFEYEESACLHIVEFQRDGLRMLPLRNFANNRDVEVLRTIQHPRLIAFAIRRLNYFVNRAETMRYNPLSQNCEHFARFVVEGKRQSKQVQKVVVLGLLVGSVVVWNRATA